MRLRQWIRLRRRPPAPPATIAERLERNERHARRDRIVNYVFYGFAIGACALAVGAAVRASDAVKAFEDARSGRLADQAATNRVFCERQREALIQQRETKLIEISFARIFLQTVQRLLDTPAPRPPTPAQRRSRAILEQTADEMREKITAIREDAEQLRLLVDGDPAAPRGSPQRRGIDCDAPPDRPLHTG